MRHQTVGGPPRKLAAWRPTSRLIALLALAGLPLLWAPGDGAALGLSLLLSGPLLLLAGLDALVLWVASRQLEAHRRHDFRLSMGEANPIRIDLRSHAAIRLTGELTDDIPDGFGPIGLESPLHLSPYGHQSLRYETRPHQRGDHQFGSIWLRLRSRLALAAIVLEVPAASEVPVYPNLRALQRFRVLARHRISRIGLHRIQGAASGGEFDRLRDYSRNDSYRDIDWKATARRDRPVVRVTRPERGQQVLLAIDTGRGMAPRIENQTRLDLALSSALLLADVALSQNDRVGLCLFSHQVERYLKPASDPGAMSRFLGQIYRAQATYSASRFLEWTRWIAPRLRRRTLIVLWTDLTDDGASAALNTAISVLLPRHLPLVVTLRDSALEALAGSAPEEGRALYHRAIAAGLLQQRETLIRRLRLRGTRVIQTQPDAMGLAVIEQYLETKFRGLL